VKQIKRIFRKSICAIRGHKWGVYRREQGFHNGYEHTTYRHAVVCARCFKIERWIDRGEYRRLKRLGRVIS